MTNSIQFEPPTGGAPPDPLEAPYANTSCCQTCVDLYTAGSTYSLHALMQRTALSPKIAALLPNINDTRTTKKMTNELLWKMGTQNKIVDQHLTKWRLCLGSPGPPGILPMYAKHDRNVQCGQSNGINLYPGMLPKRVKHS